MTDHTKALSLSEQIMALPCAKRDCKAQESNIAYAAGHYTALCVAAALAASAEPDAILRKLRPGKLADVETHDGISFESALHLIGYHTGARISFAKDDLFMMHDLMNAAIHAAHFSPTPAPIPAVGMGEQKAVAWMNPHEGFVKDAFIWSQDKLREPRFNTPVYTHPAAGQLRERIAYRVQDFLAAPIAAIEAERAEGER